MNHRQKVLENKLSNVPSLSVYQPVLVPPFIFTGGMLVIRDFRESLEPFQHDAHRQRTSIEQ